MAASHSDISNKTNNKNKPLSKLSKLFKTKLNKNREIPDNFIIRHNKINQHNNVVDIKSLDTRRKVFISIVGLYLTWQNTPAHILYSAIFILPLKKEWMYNPSKYVQELQSHSDTIDMRNFSEMLQWKSKQGLVFWMLDDVDCTNIKTNNSKKNQLIHPFWYYLSDKLNAMKHNKLNLDIKWWQNKDNYAGQYPKTSTIMCELYFLTMKFKTISTILSQTNAKSLHPIAFYTSDCDVSYQNNDGFWMSSEYDPYQMDI